MTDLSLANPQAFTKSEEETSMTKPFESLVQAIFPANTKAENEPGFLDAWLLSSNGQG